MAKKANKTFRITGLVIDSTTQQGIAGLRVEAWDKDLIFDDLVGGTVTDGQGAFQIEFTSSYFAELFLDRQPDLFFKVFREDELIKSTEDSVLWNVAAGNTEVVIEVEIPIVPGPATFLVRGQVHLGGKPYAGALVRAYYKDVLSEDPLGALAITNEEGWYQIVYAAEQFSSAEKRKAGLIVRAWREEGSEPVSSAIRFNAQPEETVDLILSGEARGSSEYEQLIAKLKPNLQNVPLHELTETQIDFLVDVTGQDRQHIAWLVQAAKLEHEARLLTDTVLGIKTQAQRPAPPASSIPTEVFYGCFRRGLPVDLNSLLQRPTLELIAEIRESIEANIVPRVLLDRLDVIEAALNQLRAARSLAPAPEGKPSSLGDLLGTLPPEEMLSRDQQLTVARLHHEHGNTDEFWKQAEAAGLSNAIPALKRTIALSDLTGGYAPVVQALQAKSDAEHPESTKFLTKLEPTEVIELVFEHGVPPGSGLDRDGYIEQLQANVENKFPMLMLSKHLERTPSANESFPTGKIVDFLKANPAFDLRKQHVEPYLYERGNRDDALREGLLQLQRIHALTGNARETVVLRDAGFGSSTQIISEGKPALMMKAGGQLSAERAGELFAAAEKVVAMVVALGTAYAAPSASGNAVMVIPALPASSVAMDKYPSLRSLFGDLDYCACRHCQSVLGPAAYLADLMHFLQRSPLTPKSGGGLLDANYAYYGMNAFLEYAAGGTVLGALLQRRPDLADLEFSCENTDTEIPYIDVVLEILENAVALPLAVLVDGIDIDAEFTGGNVPVAVANALHKTDIKVGTALHVTPDDRLGANSPFRYWIITDGSRRWLVLHLKPQFAVQSNAGNFQVPDVAGAVRSLELGTFNTELEDKLSNGLSIDGAPQIQEISRGEIQSNTFFSTLVRAWTASYTRTIAIKITMGLPMGAVELLKLDGTQFNPPRELPTAILQYIGGSFTSGATSKIDPKVAAWLDLPANEIYSQVKNPTKNWWELSVTNSALFGQLLEGLNVTGLTYQNSSIREDLKSSPENRNPAAYDILSSKSAVFPWALPFDLWLEETRAFLDALGVSRADLVDLARPQSRLSDEAVALELLGLSKSEADVITSAKASTEPWIFWGLAETNNTVMDHTAGSGWSGGWQEVLAHLSMLLQQSGLSYREYLDFLQTSFVGKPKLILFPPNECRTSKIAITGLSETEFTDHLNRIHVFTRLWRKSGWSMRDLDLALAAFSQPFFQGQVTPTSLRGLALLKRLQAALGLPVPILVGCIDTLETTVWTDHTKDATPVEPMLYDTVFQRQSLRSLSGFEDFALGKVNLSMRLSNPPYRADFVAASLGIKPDQAKAWINGTPNLGMPNADFATMDTLSCLYTAASLCRALQIAPDALPDIVALLDVTEGLFGGVPVGTNRAQMRGAAMLEFAERVGFVRESGFDFETLSYLLRHKVLPGKGSDASTRIEQQLTQTLTELRAALQTGVVLGDVSADNVKRQLARLGWYPALIDEAMGSDGLNYQPGTSVKMNPPPALTPEPLTPLNLRSKFTYQKGSPLFSVGDLKDFAGLLGKFSSTTTDALSAYLWSRIPPASQKRVQGGTLSIDQRSSILVDALNTIVEGANIYDVGRFSGIPNPPSPETIALAAQNLTGPDLVLLNGILLAEAYPQELARNQAVLKCTGSLEPSDFTSITNLFPAPKITALKDQYNAQLSAQVKILADMMRVFELPTFEEKFSNLSTLPVIPGDFKDRLTFEMTSATEGKLTLKGWLSVTERLTIANANSTNLALSTALGKLHTQAVNWVPGTSIPEFITSTDAEQLLREPDVQARYHSILLRLVSRLDLDLLITQLSTALGLDQQTVARLLDTANVNLRSAKALLTDSDFLHSDPKILLEKNHWLDQFAVIELLGKIATIASRLAIRPEQWDWVLGGPFSVMDVLALPTSAANPTSFDGWRKLVDLFNLRDVLPDGPARLTRIGAALKTPDFVAVRKEFADAFELVVDEVDEVHGACSADLLAFNGADDYSNPSRLLALAQLLHVIKALGTTSPDIPQLIQPAPDQAVAQLARKLFAAAIDASALPERMRPISDRLRSLQRNALVAYLINRDHLADSNELFDRYLIDVEMGSCMLTSRIKQAISSVQLFVQRCLLNLEPGTASDPQVSPVCIDVQRWQWMKFYRVWEANRKIFLYPENWIEPELRDDKTEIFQAFESDLLQSEITHDTALVAFRKYLDNMADIANLTVVSMFEEQTDDGGSVVHLVGRDNSTPYKHYYRQWKLRPGADFGTWTAWEEISAQLDSVHVLVFLFGGSVYLAWPTISPGQVGHLKWKIGMNLAKRSASGWTKLKKGRGEIENPMVPYKDERTSLAFRINYIDETVSIETFGSSRDFGSSPQLGLLELNETKQELVSDSFDSEAEKSGGAGISSPFLNLNLRVLDSYVYEYAGKVRQTYYRLSDVMITVTATYRYSTPKNGDWIGGWNDPIPRTPPSVTGHSKYSYNDLLGDFIGLQSITWRTPDPGGHEYHTRETLASAVRLIVTMTKGTSTIAKTVHISKGNSLTWQEDFIFELKDDPGWLSGGRTLVNAGSFTLKDDDSLALNPEQSKWDYLPVPHSNDTEHFMSGYREVGESGTLQYILGLGQSLNATPGQYFVVQAEYNGPYKSRPIYAYHDDRFSLLFWRHRKAGANYYDAGYRVVPFSTGGMFEIKRAVTKGRLLDAVALPLPVGSSTLPGRPPALKPIPLGVNGFDQNPVTSVTDVKIDFGPVPTSIYNWEVFFHNPLLVATQLSQAQRFEEAQRWFHLIFDPTTSDPDPTPTAGNPVDTSVRYWRFLPFREAGQGHAIDTLLEGLARGDKGLIENINEWADNPFRPHLVARHRVRSYQFAVVQKYVENLVAWGDQLYRRDTIESINEATQLYVLAAKILGKRPASSPKTKASPKSYRDIYRKLDDFSNAWIPLEPLIATQTFSGLQTSYDSKVGPTSFVRDTGSKTDQLYSLGSLYFCIPGNEKLSEYWDTVEDRLFKIRHCMNIEGIERQLPLFEPPIDPALLVRATAAGLDIASVLLGLDAPLPLYRFNVMVQKALELCSEVRALGNALLSALEKKDAEQLSLLRSNHEIQMLKLMRAIKEQQQAEAATNLEALRKTREVTAQRYVNYQRLMGKQNVVVPPEGTVATPESSTLQLAPPSAGDTDTEGLALISAEAGHMGFLNDANNFSLIAGSHSVLAGVFHALPNFKIGPIVFQADTGGSHLGSAMNAAGAAWGMLATSASFQAGRSATISSHQRRYDEWRFQSNTAAKELEQIDKQILANEIRKQIAEKEITNHDQQIENTQEVDDLMRSKFTNQQLYSWMVGQISGVYFRTYQLAHDIAKRAERTYRFELGLKDSASSFIEFGYWDSLKKGLLCGERLYLDLKRMEVAYFEQNKREYEITKHVSLVQLDPMALLRLKETGQCEVSLPEALLDLDFPGHYLRRIKSVSLTIPCVTGPYSSVPCTLTLLKHSVRHSSSASGNYARDIENDDPRFIDSFGAIQSIVTSSAQNDSGLFETNLRDERYLPFEGAGVISTWRLELPSEFRQFNYDTISDVVLHLRYTSRDGGELLKQQASSELTAAVNAVVQSAEQHGLERSFSLRHESPSEWYRFLNPPAEITGDQTLKMSFEKTRFPFLLQSKTITLGGMTLFVKVRQKFADSYTSETLKVSLQPGTTASTNAMELNLWNGLLRGDRKIEPAGALGDWTLAAWRDTGNGLHQRIELDAIEEIVVVCAYAIANP